MRGAASDGVFGAADVGVFGASEVGVRGAEAFSSKLNALLLAPVRGVGTAEPKS